METPQPPTLISILRDEALRTVAVFRGGIAGAQRTAARAWLSLRVWLVESLPRSNTFS